jgi:hypothetical protein
MSGSGQKPVFAALECDFRFTPESRLKSDIAACPKSADFVAKVGGYGLGRWPFR